MRRSGTSESLLSPPMSRTEFRRKLIRTLLITFIISGSLFTIAYMSGSFTMGLDDREVARAQALEYYSRTHKVEHYTSRGLFRSRQNAVIVVLCRNEDLDAILGTIRNFEFQFNLKNGYPYVFLNNIPFEARFITLVKRQVGSLSKADVKFGMVPPEHWSYPPWINQTLAAERRSLMDANGVLYGGSESYRHMCRYFSGFFQHHPLLKEYEYYWRVEPGVQFLCNIPFDPFEMMKQQSKKYGFVIAFGEIPSTIPTLWESTQEFMSAHKEHMHTKDNCFEFFVNHHGEFNYCHFWSNFEIGSFAFLRSKEYQAYFDFLDRKGGFFYERWGDAPVHSLAVGMFLQKSQVAYFEDIGYRHVPFSHCPIDISWRRENNCACDPFFHNDITHSECQRKWDKLKRADTRYESS